MPCACWIRHFLCNGARGWWGNDQWPVWLLAAVYWNAKLQATHPQAWVHWLAVNTGERGWTFHGGLN